MHASPKLLWTVLPLVVGLATPSAVIFWLEVFAAHTSLANAIVDLAQRQFAEGENLFLLALIGLIPFSLLSVASFVAARFVSGRRLACISSGGLFGILAFMVPAHVSIWYPLTAAVTCLLPLSLPLSSFRFTASPRSSSAYSSGWQFHFSHFCGIRPGQASAKKTQPTGSSVLARVVAFSA